jgi:hypothetical protein
MRVTVIAVLTLGPVLLGLGLARVSGSSAAPADNPLLVGTVGLGDSFTIDLADANGAHVSRLAPGTYTVLVHDYSAAHNFHLANEPDGKDVDFFTTVPFVGDQTFTVTFHDGLRYVYACEPHFQTMFGSFFVSAEPETPPPPPPVGKIAARVATTVSVSPRSVTPGKYAITVRDLSAAKNFHLVGPGLNRRTTKAFKGTVVWRVTLKAGTYRFGSDPRLSGILRVSV